MKSLVSKLASRLKFRRPDNLKVVVLSFGTAAIFWLFNALNKEYNTTVGYPVSWQFDTEKYMVVDELPDRIEINVNGIGWNLMRASMGFKVKPITIILANPALSKKISGVSLTNRVNDGLDELQLNYILNDTLRLNIDTRGAKSFGVYIDSANISLEENYRIVSPIAYDVDLLEIEGPITMLDSIADNKYLVKIEEEQISKDYSEEIDFTIDRPELFLFRPKSVNVAFSVKEFIDVERQVVLQQIDFPENPKVALQDTICTVQFTVQKDIEQLIVADSFNVLADYKLINKSDSTLMLSIKNSPEQALDVRIKLPQVRVNYEQ